MNLSIPVNNPLPYPSDANLGGITPDGEVMIEADSQTLIAVCLHHHDFNLRATARLMLEIQTLRQRKDHKETLVKFAKHVRAETGQDLVAKIVETDGKYLGNGVEFSTEEFLQLKDLFEEPQS